MFFKMCDFWTYSANLGVLIRQVTDIELFSVTAHKFTLSRRPRDGLHSLSAKQLGSLTIQSFTSTSNSISSVSYSTLTHETALSICTVGVAVTVLSWIRFITVRFTFINVSAGQPISEIT